MFFIDEKMPDVVWCFFFDGCGDDIGAVVLGDHHLGDHHLHLMLTKVSTRCAGVPGSDNVFVIVL